MKKMYKFMLIIVVSLMAAVSISAQETRIVKIDGWDPASGEPDSLYLDVAFDAITGDTTANGERVDPNTIYELTRGHKYPQGQFIQNYDYHLHIRAGEGDGLLPEFIVGKMPNGSYGNDYIKARNDVTLENLVFSGYRPDGAYLNRMVEFLGHKSRCVVKGCVWDGDRGAGLALLADSLTVIAEDVLVRNCGHRKVSGGNGRIVDFRPQALYVDTLKLINTTVTNASDRVIRNMGTEVNYLEIDHMTVLNNVGYHGAVQLGFVHTAKVTNSLFANAISWGHSEWRIQEQTQPEKHFAVITLDTVFDGQVIEIRNNNVYWDTELTDVWAKYDSVSAPWDITPTIETALGDAAGEATFNEILTLATSCEPISAYVDAFYANPTAAEFPENWCVGGEGGYFYDQVDYSYSSDAVSFTAADNGYPVGDLNYFPALKASWEAGVPAAIEPTETIRSNGLRSYPNPSSGSTTVRYELEQAADVNLGLYNISGQKVMQLRNEFQHAGTQEVVFHPENLPGGVYLLKLEAGSSVSVSRMVISR